MAFSRNTWSTALVCTRSTALVSQSDTKAVFRENAIIQQGALYSSITIGTLLAH